MGAASMATAARPKARPRTIAQLRADRVTAEQAAADLRARLAALDEAVSWADPEAVRESRALQVELGQSEALVAQIDATVARLEKEAAASERAARIRAAEAVLEQAARSDAAAFDAIEGAWEAFVQSAQAKVERARALFAARDVLNAAQGDAAQFMVEPYVTIRARPLGLSGQADTMVQWSRRLTPGLIRTLCRVEP